MSPSLNLIDDFAALFADTDFLAAVKKGAADTGCLTT